MQELVEQVMQQFASTNQYDRFIKDSQKQYDIKIYRLPSFSLSYARTVYQQLQQKYDSGLAEIHPAKWNQNQRRFYVWFIICFMHLKMLDPVKFLDGCEKYWKLVSEAFWEKSVPFLKYQLLNIIKTKGRTVWKEQEDALLKEAYNKHEKGQWNEIAKYFYFASNGQHFKTPKQCRERWQNHLNQQIKKGEWTVEQDRNLFAYVRKNGTKWAKIVTDILKGTRTEHMAKNRYKSLVNKMMAEKGVQENQAVELVLKQLGDRSVKQKVQNDIIREKIQFVESQQILSEEPEEEREEEIKIRKKKISEKQQDTHLPVLRKQIRKQRSKKETQKKQKIKEQHTKNKTQIANASLTKKQQQNDNANERQIDGCKIQGSYNLKNPIIFNNEYDSFFKSQNSLINNSINSIHFLFSSNKFPTTPLQLPNTDDRSLLGFEKISGANMDKLQPLFQNDSIHSKNSSFYKLNNQSIVGKYISERGQEPF